MSLAHIGKNLGYKHTEETKQKMKDAHQHLKPNLGKKDSNETRLKKSEAAQNRPSNSLGKTWKWSEEAMKNHNKYKVVSLETRQKMSLAAKQRHQRVK